MSSGSWNQGWGEFFCNVSKKEVTHGIPAHGEETEGDKGPFWACTVQYKDQMYIGKCTDKEDWFGFGGKGIYVKKNFWPFSNASDLFGAPT